MAELQSINRKKYRAALDDMKAVHEMGLEVKFQSVIKKYKLHPATKAALIPNLAGVDLDKEFESLYKAQEALVLDIIKRGRECTNDLRKRKDERLKYLEKENALLRAKLVRAKNVKG